jgi:hypothetical protein
MSSSCTPVLERFRAALEVLDDVSPTLEELRALTDAQLCELSTLHTTGGRSWGSAGAVIAGELSHRSRPELGSDGLARRTGHRTVENLLKATTGATKEQVLTVVAAGTLLTEIADEGTVDEASGEVRSASQPWLRPVAAAVASGALSTSASGSIARGLGSPNSAVTADQLQAAAVQLVAMAIGGVDADRLWREARNLRNEIDLDGVKLREEERRQLRGLTHYPLPAGGGRAIWEMDTETYATFVDTYDRLTSPKRGGVRFVDKTKAAQAKSIHDDERTFAQIASDGFIHLLAAGADIDDSVMLGSGGPVIRITVAEKALTTGIGFGRIDGQPDVVCIDTVKRLICQGTEVFASFDPNGHYVEPSEDHRLFSKRQREILAAKFGGCMDPDCDRPPSWCEAHHIQQWIRDGGKTLIGNGIPLCKFHHLKYHNDGYEIILDAAGNYWKIPPESIDPAQTPIHMRLKTRNLHDLHAANQRTPEPALERAFERAAR